MHKRFPYFDSKLFILDGTAIIKPVDSASSRGISKIPSEDELHAKWDEAKMYSSSGDVILERFVEGIQFEVDSIAVNGEVKTLMYADLNEFKIPNVFSSMSRLYPSVTSDDIIERLLDYNLRINKGFGMKHGLSHNEYIMDERTGQIYLIEAALRGGGTYIASVIAKLQTGINTAEFLINAALGNITRVPEFEMNQCHSGYVAFYLPVGEVVDLEGAEEIDELEFVDKSQLYRIKIGNKTEAASDKNQRCAIVLHAESREELLERIAIIRHMLKIKVKTENGIKGPIWE